MRFGYIESPVGYYRHIAFSPVIRQMICICKYGDRALRIGLTLGNLICKPFYEYSPTRASIGARNSIRFRLFAMCIVVEKSSFPNDTRELDK